MEFREGFYPWLWVIFRPKWAMQSLNISLRGILILMGMGIFSHLISVPHFLENGYLIAIGVALLFSFSASLFCIYGIRRVLYGVGTIFKAGGSLQEVGKALAVAQAPVMAFMGVQLLLRIPLEGYPKVQMGLFIFFEIWFCIILVGCLAGAFQSSWIKAFSILVTTFFFLGGVVIGTISLVALIA